MDADALRIEARSLFNVDRLLEKALAARSSGESYVAARKVKQKKRPTLAQRKFERRQEARPSKAERNAERREQLKLNFGFGCQCALCGPDASRLAPPTTSAW